MADLPHSAQPWPADREVPRKFSSITPTDLADGLYFSRWPNQKLRWVGRVQGGQIVSGLNLESEREAGWCYLGGPPWVAQSYADGRMEDFSPWDDNSPAYPATQKFGAWVREQIRLLGPGPEGGLPALDPVYAEYLKNDRSRTVPAHATELHSGNLNLLEEVLEELNDCQWSHRHQCYERLVNYFKLDLDVARDLTNYGPLVAGGGTFVYPVWNGPPWWAEEKLETVPIYRRLQELSAGQRWVLMLGRLLGSPVVWTLPPKPACGFHLTRVAAATLRQAGDGLEDAFRSASQATNCWYHDPTAWPWTERDDLADHNRALAELMAGDRWDKPALPWLDEVAHDLAAERLPWTARPQTARARDRAEEFARGGIEAVVPDFRTNAFLYRISEGGPERDAFVAGHKTLSEQQLGLLESILGAPPRPGPTFVRHLAAAHWALGAPWDDPERSFFPALRLTHWLLSAHAWPPGQGGTQRLQ